MSLCHLDIKMTNCYSNVMQTTIRTTIRIRKDLLDQSRRIALERGMHLQDVINDTLAIGYGHVSDLNRTKNAMKVIDTFREDMKKKQGAAFSLQKFHDDFLREGFPPVKVVREAMLGDQSPTL